jgi:hypothetical protein
MACIPFDTQTKKSKYITLLHRYIWVVLCMGAAVFGGEAGFRHHGKGGLVERVRRVVKARDARCCANFWTFATTHSFNVARLDRELEIKAEEAMVKLIN